MDETQIKQMLGSKSYALWEEFKQPVEPEVAAPRQDSLTNQLLDVHAAAVRMGCYDAADWICGWVGDSAKRS